jgi:O-antigen/teichoic acid export membrane protein
VASFRLVRRFVPYRVLSFSPRRAAWLVRESVPIGAVNVVLIVYLAIDVILLSRLAGESAAGVYAAPMRVFGTLLFAPTLIATVLFPRLAATAVRDREAFARLCDGAVRVVLGVTVLAALGASTVGRDLVVTVFGSEFAGSGDVLAVMAIALVPTSINMVAHRILVALDRQSAWTAVMLAALAVKVVLDAALIPTFDRATGNPALGAATALAAAEAAMMVVALRMLPAGLLQGGLGRHAARLAVAALSALGAAYLVRGYGAVGSGLSALAVFLALCAVARIYTVSDLRGVLSAASGRGAPLPSAVVEAVPSSPFTVLLWDDARLKENRPASRHRGLRLVASPMDDWYAPPVHARAALVPGPRWD